MVKRVELVLQPEEAADEQVWRRKAAKASGFQDDEISACISRKKSIDARSNPVRIRLVVDVYAKELPSTEFSTRNWQDVSNKEPVIIIGCGPAGLFSAIRLIELGYKPVIIERGKNIKERRRDLAILNKQHIVNPDSNYCFGEGGAGTYSDGKLYTRSGKRGNIQKILDTFIEFGATNEISIDAHPHIGTNKLPGIISAMREMILKCGGEILFNHRFTGFEFSNKLISGIQCADVNNPTTSFSIKSRTVILATGHSANDIYEYFNKEKFEIIAKPFAVGVRIEHPQKIIDTVQYHCPDRGLFLPPAPYTLSAQENGRGVYSFCMCPGGVIAAATTSPASVVVNGWSPSKRNNPFANSGIVVSVDDVDFIPFEKYGALKGLKFQQSVEEKAFIAGGNNLSAPAQRMMDFIDKKNSSSLPSCSYIPGIKAEQIDHIFPPAITLALREGLKTFSKKMKGFLTNEAVLVAPESRTSSPVKIPRDNESLMHPEIPGLFPCGEGAGYAGGIMSAAIDGERIAEKVAEFIYHSNRT